MSSHPVRIKTLILYNKRRLQPETIDALATAKDGAWMGLEPDEFNAIQQLHIFVPEIQKMQRNDQKARPRDTGEVEGGE